MKSHPIQLSLWQVALCVGLAIARAGCSLPFGLAGQGGQTAGSNWQAAVDGVAALQSGLRLPDNLQKTPSARASTDFDVARYFEALPRLSMEPGYVLDYVYYMDGFGGLPWLYARPAETPRYATFADWSKANPGMKNDAYLQRVRADGTPEGYFQYVVLAMLGGEFYLYWHAAAGEIEIIAGQAALETLLADLANPKSGKAMPAADISQARKISVEPQVEIGAEKVTVKLISFSRSRGFIQNTLTFNKAFPHTIQERKQDMLIQYNWGIVY